MNPFLMDMDRGLALATEQRHQQEEGCQRRMRMPTLSPRTVLVIVIYGALLLDNILLTVIVPILPDFLLSSRERTATGGHTDLLYKKYDFEVVSNILTGRETKSPGNSTNVSTLHLSPTAAAAVAVPVDSVGEENVSIGVLLATKAFVQLAVNPIVGAATKRIGYHWPILLGTLSLLLSSVLFAIGDHYYSLLFARAVQGVGSSCLAVSGMSLVAALYPEDDKRSRVMGIVLGSIALGVLIGYPVGGILYDFVGKSSPFWIISTLLVAVVCVQVKWLNLSSADLRNCCPGTQDTGSGEGGGGMDSPPSPHMDGGGPKWKDLLMDFEINLISLAIFISTSAMAILEPCLPLWLLTNLHPEKWQLGTVFIPDSLGYLIGTNGFGRLAFEWGQTRVAVVALLLIGCSCVIIPGSTSMSSLLVPHFGLGFGIGVLDASLVPYLSSRIDAKYSGACSPSECSVTLTGSYGTVYAIQQMAVSLAYSASPILASEIVKFMGFPTLMLLIGVVNVVYAFVFFYFTTTWRGSCYLSKDKQHLLLATSNRAPLGETYSRFYNTTN